MTRRYMDLMFWKENKDWYSYDEEKQEFVLTQAAPEEARRNFKLWQEMCDRDENRRRLGSAWSAEDDWYYYDEDAERYILTDKAPEEARRSFELWKKIVHVDWDAPPQPRPTH